MAAPMKLATICGKTWQEGDWWFSMADKLPIAGFGKTAEEAMSRAIHALHAYLQACTKDNELIATLEHYDLIVEQKSQEYTFCFETPVGERGSDLVLAR